MKRILILAICMIMILCTACTSLDDDDGQAVKKDVFDIYEQLRTSWKHADNIDEIKKPLTEWADENEISSAELSCDNILMTLDATDEYRKAPQTIIQCDIGTGRTSSRAQCAAIAMAALKNSEMHGIVKLLFTASDQNKYYGVEELSSKQLRTDNLISLDYCKNTKLYTGSAAAEEYILTKNIKTEKTQGNVSYKILFSGLEGGDSSDRTKKHGNPIKALGQLMHSCQSSGIAFQISSFKGGLEPGTYPEYAEMVITVDENDENKLLEKITSCEEEFEDTYRDDENELKVSHEKCSTPKKTYSEIDTANLISFLYTIEDGVYSTVNDADGDERASAIANIGIVRSSDKLTIGIKARSIDPNIFKELYNTYKSTAELSDFKIKKTSSFPCWPYKEYSNLSDSFTVAAGQMDIDLEPKWTFSENECALIYNKRQDMDMICIGSNIQSGKEIASSIILYLQSLNKDASS